MTIRLALSRAFVVALLGLASCASDPNRLEGHDYGRDGAPFVSDTTTTLADAAAFPNRERTLAHRVLLVGDAGDPRDNEPTLEALGRWGNARPGRTTVLFLGDNLYPAGLQEDDRERGEAVLRSQLEATVANKIFLPGNHDWGFPNLSVENVGRQQRYIEDWPSGRADFLPKDGCPGPAVRTLAASRSGLDKNVSLVALDLQWWLLEDGQRPNCGGAASEEEIVDALREALRSRSEEWVIVAAHHPLVTGGPHGGLSYGPLAEPLIALAGWYFGTLQNVYEPRYAAAIEQIRPALETTRPLMFAAGHDHSLQLIEGGAEVQYHVVSGAGATRKVSTVTDVDGTLFAHAHPGFIAIDFLVTPSGDEVLLHVVEAGVNGPVLSTRLAGPGAEDSTPSREPRTGGSRDDL
jgi:hypothetical protein